MVKWWLVVIVTVTCALFGICLSFLCRFLNDKVPNLLHLFYFYFRSAEFSLIKPYLLNDFQLKVKIDSFLCSFFNMSLSGFGECKAILSWLLPPTVMMKTIELNVSIIINRLNEDDRMEK